LRLVALRTRVNFGKGFVPFLKETQLKFKNLRDHRVAALVKNILQLDNSGGSDVAALARARDLVANELLHQDEMEVIVGALGQLERESAADQLKAIVSHCHDHFYMGDQVLSAIVVPVAVKVKTLAGHSVAFEKGEGAELRDLASAMRDSLRSRQVQFDSRFYDGQSLYALKASELRMFLSQLERGVVYPESGPRALRLRGEVEPQWNLIYFLGVEATQRDQQRRLNDPSAQELLRPWLHFGACAVEGCWEVFFDRQVAVDAQCHGVWYLQRGLEEGARQLRACRLQAVLAGSTQGTSGIRLYYSPGLDGSTIRLLITSPLMATQYTWKFMAGDTIDVFRMELKQALSGLIPVVDVLELVGLNAQEYAKTARSHGLPLSGAH